MLARLHARIDEAAGTRHPCYARHGLRAYAWFHLTAGFADIKATRRHARDNTSSGIS